MILGGSFDPEKLQTELNLIETRLQDPEVWQDHKKLNDLNKQKTSLETKVKEPKNFDLDEFIHKNNLGFAYSDELYTFEAVFDRTMAFHLLETPLNSTQTAEELPGNKLLIKARVPDTLQFEQWLMSFGADVEILKPAKLRNKFKELSKNLNSI